MEENRFAKAFEQFDAYNNKDPKVTLDQGKSIPDALLYAQRMTSKLEVYVPDASEHLQLAARCQHIGRWEIPRSQYPMDRKGYMLWRSQLKKHHVKIAIEILEQIGFESANISKVCNLLLKKQLKQNPETQALEDVICFVFLQYYFDEFSTDQNEGKLINILKKTIAKMSSEGIAYSMKLPLSEKSKSLVKKALEK